MRRRLFIALVIMLCISLAFVVFPLVEAALDRGRIANVELDIGESDRFTQEEIASAMDVVKEIFADHRGWNDELISLWYNEASSNREIERREWDEDNTIVLFSTWYQGQGLGAPRAFMPWTWILARESSSDSWVFVTGGKV